MYLGKLLSEEYDIAPRQDKTFEKSRIRYEQKLDTIKLHEIDDSYEYLDFLKVKMDNDKSGSRI